MHFRIFTIIAIISVICLPAQANAELVKIAVLSSQDFQASMKKWQSTADYLTATIPSHVFQILPYSHYPDLESDMKKNKLDFLITAKNELPRFAVKFSIMPLMTSKPMKKETSWALVRKRNLPYQLSYRVSEALLNLTARHNALKHARLAGWKLSADAEVSISPEQKVKKQVSTFIKVTTSLIMKYRSYLLAVLVSALLIFLYRKWDQYHLAQQARQHRQQDNDSSLSDTVF